MENGKHVVLVVEDDSSTANALKMKLEEEDFVVSVAVNGVECLESVKNKIPDIILLDVMMPVMGGMETLKKLKEDEKTKDLPIVLLTNVDSEESLANALEGGAQDYLVKADHTLENVVAYVKNKLK